MWQTFLDLLFPRQSLTGTSGVWITPAERTQLTSHPVIETAEQLRSRKILFLDELRAGSTYQDCLLLKRALHIFKYRGVRSLAQDLGALIPATDVEQGTVLCPVPLHWTRRFARGFNQAALLAEDVSARTGIPVRHLLTRIHSTGHQARRSRRERLVGVRGAFRSCGTHPPQHVVLIDDVATTGATLDACAQILKIVGVHRVTAWVVAHDS
ncbi:MAG: hypothetical protein WCX61_00320 [Candidatus Peribacteraceae bacterium]|jgi:ComF family protein